MIYTGQTFLHFRNGQHPMMANTILVQGKAIRTDWIHLIQRGTENGTLTCTIWLAVGPVSVYSFKGGDAETALNLLANHPLLQA
jgi:hypothetical protein